jgi:hypothetical protein
LYYHEFARKCGIFPKAPPDSRRQYQYKVLRPSPEGFAGSKTIPQLPLDLFSNLIMSELRPVLAIGLAGFGGMTPAQMTEATKQMAQACSDVGIAFDARFIHADLPEEERVSLKECLKSKQWAVVSVGSGLRLDEANTRLLEDVVDMVLSTVKPTPKLAFPTLPGEMIPTFQRLLQ